MQGVGNILDRALEQENAARFQRTNDLHALVGRQPVSRYAEAEQLATGVSSVWKLVSIKLSGWQSRRISSLTDW